MIGAAMTQKQTPRTAMASPSFGHSFMRWIVASWARALGEWLRRLPDQGHEQHARSLFALQRQLDAAFTGAMTMSKIASLQELYVDELKDLWSANDQMAKALKKITSEATDPKLKQLLATSPDGIGKHTDVLKDLIEAQGEKLKKEHCKGMEGLVAEAIKHTIDDAPESGPVLDAAIIAQYQRMTHYGITGFGTVAAFAKALKLDDDATKLETAVKEMHSADDLMSELAESAVNTKAVDA